MFFTVSFASVQLTVTKMQWKSCCSFWFWLPSVAAPNRCWSRLNPHTRRMVKSFSWKKACISVKWICTATSSVSSAASKHRTAQSGSLRGKKKKKGEHDHLHNA